MSLNREVQPHMYLEAWEWKIVVKGRNTEGYPKQNWLGAKSTAIFLPLYQLVQVQTYRTVMTTVQPTRVNLFRWREQEEQVPHRGAVGTYRRRRDSQENGPWRPENRTSPMAVAPTPRTLKHGPSSARGSRICQHLKVVIEKVMKIQTNNNN